MVVGLVRGPHLLLGASDRDDRFRLADIQNLDVELSSGQSFRGQPPPVWAPRQGNQPRVVAWQGDGPLLPADVPHLDGSAPAGRGEAPAVRVPGEQCYMVDVSAEHPLALTCCRMKDFDRLRVGGAYPGNPLPVRTPGGRLDAR